MVNRGVGLRLDVESRANQIEHNVVLDHRPVDVADAGSDNTFALNVFERGDGVSPTRLAPLVPEPGQGPPGVAGCGTMHTMVTGRQTVTLCCPQAPGLRGLRNSVVAHRLLSAFQAGSPFDKSCDPVEVEPATSAQGAAVTCTNPDSIWPAVLEITCCLN